MMAPATKRPSKDEPNLREILADDIEEWGGELWFTVGHTSGGAPYGTLLSELERDEVHSSSERWARAKRQIERAFGDDAPRVGRVRHLGEGLSRSAWVADVAARSFDGVCVALLPHADVAPEYVASVRRECRILAELSRRKDLPFRVARPLALLMEADAPVLVEESVGGAPLHMRADRGQRPWAVIGQLAAAVHRLDVEAPGPATRQEVALETIAEIAEHDCKHPLVADALAFARCALPSTAPTCFVHGDLLGQNILLACDDPRPALIDFERAERGDPAQEIAIVTRGVRRPFGIDGGLEKLLDDYRTANGRAIDVREVRVYEALLLAGHVAASVRENPRAISPAAQTLASLLKRL
jgi:aminoglycoside phosphotransferase (APT) family kinase protein